MEQLQSHIWLTASSYMGKYMHISSYMTLQLLHSEFPYTNVYEENLIFFFYQCNFDRVFTIFFSQYFSWVTPLQKIYCTYKTKLYEMPKSKFSFCTLESPQNFFSESVKVTTRASIFDRYIYFLKIMSSREQNWERSRLCSLILVYVHIKTQIAECYWSDESSLSFVCHHWRYTLHGQREKSSGQAILFNIWTIWAKWTEPQLNLRPT